jgi:Putative metallopeptidase
MASAEVIIAPQAVSTAPKQHVVVPAQRLAIYELGNLEPGDAVAVQVDIANAVYKDLSVYVVDVANVALVRQNLAFRFQVGALKKVAPFRLSTKIATGGPYYLVLDNRFAAIIEKKVDYQVALLKQLSQEQIQAQKVPLEKLYAGLKNTFAFKDFNIHVRPCGHINAFSTKATGDVTICSEILADMSRQPGAMTAVLIHELGHTLLNLWGYPNYQNEDDADQFATIMLLRSGDKGKQALYEWMQWYARQDSRAQAQQMLSVGDTHALSVQRIRNIQASMNNSADLIKRWNNILYPNMTVDTLKSVVSHPASYDDPEAAKRELSRR